MLILVSQRNIREANSKYVLSPITGHVFFANFKNSEKDTDFCRCLKFCKMRVFYGFWSKTHFFSHIYIYLLIFSSQLNGNKSGFLTRNPANPHKYVVFPWPLLFLKVGRKWANDQKLTKILQN